MPKSEREIILPNIYNILPNLNQVITTMDTINMPNIMTLAQGVPQIFCSQGHLWVKMPKSEKGDSSVKYWHNFMKR